MMTLMQIAVCFLILPNNLAVLLDVAALLDVAVGWPTGVLHFASCIWLSIRATGTLTPRPNRGGITWREQERRRE